MSVELKSPLIVALDVDSKSEVIHLAKIFAAKVGAFKIGPSLVTRYGSDFVSSLAQTVPMFIDNKYLDIPNTMEASVRASFNAGASFVTVHTWAGREALERMAKLEEELTQQRPFTILGVTILTSFSEKTLPPGLEKKPLKEHIIGLARLATECGIKGLVCSPQDLVFMRKEFPDSFLVTPGVRMKDEDNADQKRVSTPEEAIKKGASAIVVGRPIVQAKDPLAALDKYIKAITLATPNA